MAAKEGYHLKVQAHFAFATRDVFQSDRSLLDPSRPLFAEIHGCARDLQSELTTPRFMALRHLNATVSTERLDHFQLMADILVIGFCAYQLNVLFVRYLLQPLSILWTGLWQRTYHGSLCGTFTSRKSDCCKLGGLELRPIQQWSRRLSQQRCR